MTNDPRPEIVMNFEVPDGNFSIDRISRGHINDTFLIVDDHSENRYILQKINQSVFSEPAKVCDNSAMVLEHINKKLKAHPEINYRSIIQYKRKGGISFYQDENKDHWRLTSYVSDSSIFDTTSDAVISKEAGRIIGTFQMLIQELGSELCITIPGFHDFHKRIGEFGTAIEKRIMKRQEKASAVIGKAERWAIKMQEYYDELTQSGIPERGIHNDTKLNNVLFGNDKKAMCLIDLDTVMPGYIHFDFGDAIRTLANIADEDEKHVEKIGFSESNFSNFSAGYLSVTKKFLTNKELSLLSFSPLYMTYLIGLRFLTDYISGDVYFHTAYEDHNFIRARNQFEYLRLLENYQPFLKKTIEKHSLIS